MPGLKKQQRTKGNAKPSSSSRAAQQLEQDSTGFAGLMSGGSLFKSSTDDQQSVELDGEVKIVLQKMKKKDSVTRLKAVQEFTALCTNNGESEVKIILTYWPRLYNKLSLDTDHRVREAGQQAHEQVTMKAGRDLAPHLKLLIVPWLMSHFDPYAPAASVAVESFKKVFPDRKQVEVLAFCKKTIVEQLSNNIINETVETLSDTSLISPEDCESKYNHFISSSLLALSYLVSHCPEDLTAEETLQQMFASKKFWKHGKSKSAMIRRAFYMVLTSFCHASPTYMSTLMPVLAPAVLYSLDESEPIVVQPLWDLLLVMIHQFEDCWKNVNVRKAVLPKLWLLLRNRAYGNSSVVLPNLLPFLSKLPSEVIGTGSEFYAELFSNIREGLAMPGVLSTSECNVIVSSLMECIRYVVTKTNDNSTLADEILKNQIEPMIKDVFSQQTTAPWCFSFLQHLKLFLDHLNHNLSVLTSVMNEDKDKNLKMMETSQATTSQARTQAVDFIWQALNSNIFTISDERTVFSENVMACKSYETILYFVDLFIDPEGATHAPKTVSFETDCEGTSSLANVVHSLALRSEVDVLQMNGNEHLKQLICNFLGSAVLYITETPSKDMNLVFVKFLCKVLSLDTMMHVIQITGGHFVADDRGDICCTFVKDIIMPLLVQPMNNSNEFVKLPVMVLEQLNDNEKDGYLQLMLQESEMLPPDTTLKLFKELLTASSSDHVVAEFLRSQKIQETLILLCTERRDQCLASEDNVKSKWDILQLYLSVMKDHASIQHSYLENLLAHIQQQADEYFGLISESESSIIHLPAFLCFKNIATTSKDFPTQCYKIMLTISNIIAHFTDGFVIGELKAIIAHVLNEINLEDNVLIEFIRELIELSHNTVQGRRFHDYNVWIAKTLESTRKQFGVKYIHSLLLIPVANEASVTGENLFGFLIELCKDRQLLFSTNMDAIADHVISRLSTLPNAKPVFRDDLRLLLTSFRDIDLVDALVTKVLHKMANESAKLDLELVTMVLSIVIEEDMLSTETLTNFMGNVDEVSYKSFYLTSLHCIVIRSLTDLQYIEKLALKAKEDLENTVADEGNNDMGVILKLLTALLNRWHHLSPSITIYGFPPQGFEATISIITGCILNVKDRHQNYEVDADTDEVTSRLILEVVRFLADVVKCSAPGWTGDDWDFVLCCLASWMQSIDESFTKLSISSYGSDVINVVLQLMFEVNNLLGRKSTALNDIELVSELRTDQQVPVSNDMRMEWQEFFMPTIFKNIYSIFMKITSAGLMTEHPPLLLAVCRCVSLLSKEFLSEVLFEDCTSDVDRVAALAVFTKKMSDSLHRNNHCLQVAAYQMLSRMASLIQVDLCTTLEEDEEKEFSRTFPDCLIDTMTESRDQALVQLSDEGASISDPLPTMDDHVSRHTLLTYLLSWQLMLKIFKMAPYSERAGFANYFRHNNLINELMTCLFCVIPTTVCQKELVHQCRMKASQLDFPHLQKLAYEVLLSSLEAIPAIIQAWFNNQLDRKQAAFVSKFISAYISPVLLGLEFERLDSGTKSFSNMMIRTRAGAREVVAVYTMEEMSMELILKLAENHPLAPVSVECGKRVAVSNAEWRQWMLQLTRFLTCQNGTILDGLLLWKKNVDKQFDGVEECMVCFSILHGTNYSLPSISCKTCKKKFHAACLYKWFSTSNNSTCPLCRNIF